MKSLTMVGAAMLLLLFSLPYESNASVVVTGELVREKEAAPGSTYSGYIELSNPATEAAEVKMYLTDYLFYSDGRIAYGEAGSSKRSNAPWITFTPQRVTVGPGQSEAVSYTVQIPDDAGLKGTFWSMFMVEPVSKDSPEASDPEADRPLLAIRQVVRYGIQIITHIGNTGVRDLKIAEARLVRTPEGTMFEVDTENSGERSLRAVCSMEVYDSKANYIATYEGSTFTLFPGTSARYRIDISDLAAATYRALVIFDCGGDYIFGANYTLALQ